MSVWLLPPQVFPCGSWWIAGYVISPKMPESPHANVTQVAIPRHPYRLLLPMPTILIPCTRGTGNIMGRPRWGAKRAEKRGNRRVGMLPMRNVSQHGAAPQDESANSCISNIRHTAPVDERPRFPATFCGIVYRADCIRLYVLQIKHAPPPLCFLQHPPSCLWYDGDAHGSSDRASGKEETGWTLSR